MKILKYIGIGIGIFVLLDISYVANKWQTQKFASDMKVLKDMQIELDEIAKEQMKQQEQINGLALMTVGLMQNVFGKASYYDYELSSGWSSKGHRVCASRTYKRGTTLIVRNVANDKEVECLVTDYGPDESIHPDRIIDLSSYAFSLIAEPKLGLIDVSVRPLTK